MFSYVNVFNLSLFASGIIAILCGLLVFFNDNKSKISQSWLALNVFSGVWSIGYSVMITVTSAYAALISNWILHYAAIILPSTYLFFAAKITKHEKVIRFLMPVIMLITAIFLFINPSPLFVEGVVPKGPFNFAPDPGPFYIIFTLYFFLVCLIIVYLFMRAVFRSSVEREKQKFRLILFVFIAGVVGGGSVFLFTYNIFFPPYTFFLFAIYTITLTYILLKRDFFDVKVISTEILTFLLWIILVLRIISSNSHTELVFNSMVFVAVFILGIFLMRGVMKEVQLREKTEKLALNLAQANNQLRVMDQQKSEFLSIASHQFRSPLTAIKGYTSLVLDGTYGQVPEKIKDPIERIFHSVNNLALVVDDFLSLSRIEQGKLTYDFEETDVYTLVDNAVKELLPVSQKKGLSLSFSDDGQEYKALLDQGKFKQVVTNLIDNSIKYTPSGSVYVSLNKRDSVIHISVKDTGIGISKENIGRLFGQFVRATNANTANVMGTGLGLYIAKQITEAHKGRIWVESEGEGKGSAFYIEIPSL